MEQQTNAHQDHVIAHVIGTRVMGHFVFDESIYLLLDIGFVWQIYLNAEMGLLPCSVVLQELTAGEEYKAQLRRDCDLLLEHGPGHQPLEQMTAPPVECVIQEVQLFVNNDEHTYRVFLHGEDGDLFVECSLNSREIVLRVKE